MEIGISKGACRTDEAAGVELQIMIHGNAASTMHLMGKCCYPIVRNWVTGRDIHTLLDVSIAELWLTHYPEIKRL